ncbi:hypothetical protein ABZW18_00145 [Streptomyces sp. NPDC004647]|uniref:hypothetical protein n=1 Tax=Streptomyces sp. NPDC004647 TaxID=3154671 RepID=UPI0033A6526E
MTSSCGHPLLYRLAIADQLSPIDCLLCGIPFEHDQHLQLWGHRPDGTQSVICNGCVDAHVPEAVSFFYTAALAWEVTSLLYPLGADLHEQAATRLRTAEKGVVDLLVHEGD